MRRLLALVLGAALAASAPVRAGEPPRTVRELMRDARAAYDRGDHAAFRKDYEEAARLRPADPLVLYNLACAQALDGQTDAALSTLRRYAAEGLSADLDADSDFASLRGNPEYRQILEGMAFLRQQRITSGASAAFTIPQKGLAPEGVAYDPASKAFFVASVRQGKIFRIGPDRRVAEFATSGSGLKSPLGMGVDAKRRTLWVANETIPHMNGGKEGDPPDSALFEFDLDSGRLRNRHVPPPSGKPPYFDDLAVAPDGRVFVNDGHNAGIYALAPGGSLGLWLETDAMDGGTQGLSTTPDGRFLYVSDYRALYRVEVETKTVTPLPVPPGVATAGVDGLVYFEGRLVAIQNGVQPNRVSVFELAKDGVGIRSARILVMNHPDFDEPTLGTVVDGVLYFSANNQGHRYQDAKNPPTPDELKDAVILEVSVR